jgi:hypothetical protein
MVACIKSIQAHGEDVTDEQFAELRELYEALSKLQRAVVFKEVPVSAHKWTRAFHGLQHLGALSTEKVWVTVRDFGGDFATLSINYPGCGFTPEVKRYTNLAAAKLAGEKIMEKQS